MSNADEQSQGVHDQAARGQSVLLPGNLTHESLAKVYVQRVGDRLRVDVTVWMETDLERCQTGVALDASMSMKGFYGRMLAGNVPQDVLKEYERKGWIKIVNEDGRTVYRWLKEDAFNDALTKQYLNYTENIVQPLARDFIAYLARELDAGAGTSVIYWACGDGRDFEVLGDFTHDQCEHIQVAGPKQHAFGKETHLAPAMRYFLDRFESADHGMFIFITDGRLDDLDEVKRVSTHLAQRIEAGDRHDVKCVLIGVGDQIDEDQMKELDDLETGTEVDIWDHKIAKEMRALSEIVVELVNEQRIVAPSAAVYDDQGNRIALFSDGLPAVFAVEMPASSKHFVLDAGGQQIQQTVCLPGA